MLRRFQLRFRALELEVLFQVLVKLLFGVFGSGLGVDFENDEFHAVAKKIATEADIDSSFYSIAGKNPQFDTSVTEMLDRIRNAVL